MTYALALALMASGITVVLLMLRLRQRERALAAREARLRDLVELTSDWYWEQDAGLRFSSITCSGTAKPAFTAEFIRGKRRWELHILGVSEEQWRAHRAGLERREPFHDFVFESVGENGNRRWTSVSGKPLFAADGQFLGYHGTGRDITAQVCAEHALRESEAHLRAASEQIQMLIQCAPLAVYTLDASGLVSSWNPAAEAMYGWMADEVLGKPLPTVPEEARSESEEMRQRLLAGESFIEHETRRCRRDGSQIDIDAFLGPLRNTVGNIDGTIAIATDVTERKRAQEVLQMHSLVLRSMAEGVSYVDTQEGVIRYTNPAFDRIFGYEPGELIGQPIAVVNALPSEESARLVSKIVSAIRKGGEWDGEFLNRRKDGSVIHTHARITGVRHAGETWAVGVQEDITERKRIHETLRENEARLREAQRMACLGNWELDLLKNKLAWSDEVFRIFETDANRFGASYEAVLAAVHPDDRAAVDEVYTRSVHKHAPYEFTHRLLMSDGRVKYVHARGKTVYDERGQPLRSIGTVQDITEQKRVEAELGDYAHRLQEAYRHLARIQETERRQVAGNLHDSMGRDLTALAIDIDLIRAQLPTQALPDVDTRLDDARALIASAMQNVRSLVADLRPPLLEEWGLLPALRWHAAEFSKRLAIPVELAATVDNGARLSDEVELALFRVAQEALLNTCKHARAGRIDIGLEIDSGRTTLTITDDGVGFVVGDTDSGQTILGLGLALMRERMEAVGGRLQVVSSPGRGTTISAAIKE